MKKVCISCKNKLSLREFLEAIWTIGVGLGCVVVIVILCEVWMWIVRNMVR